MAKDKVSKKISLLRSEGKPQKQAVAIALDMQRRKKLNTGGNVENKKFKNGVDIKGQGMVPYASSEKIKVSDKPEPGMGSGVSRAKGIAERGFKFKGVF